MNHKTRAELFIRGAAELISCDGSGDDPLGRIPGGSIAVAEGKIIALGPEKEIKDSVNLADAEIIDAAGKVAAPGFVDCHTHVVFGGSRATEYAMKMTMSRAEIETTGLRTGIPASIHMTRETGEDELFSDALDRLSRMLRCGTTTIESKSGYGITWPHERKMLEVNRHLADAQPIDLVSTFLGAHDFPPEIDRENKKQRERYIEELTEEMIPRAAEERLAEFCDVYCDTGYYSTAESERILRCGMQYGLAPRIHTDAYANIGGSVLAAELPAVSADHLNYISRNEMEALAENGVIGVVLPALDFAVAHPAPFNPRPMIEAGMTMALGTNLNPGNWTESMQLVMQFACRNHGMSPAEAMLAATVGAARAIKRDTLIGKLKPGCQADIQIWNLPSFEDIIYRLGNNAVHTVIKKGRVVVTNEFRRNEMHRKEQ